MPPLYRAVYVSSVVCWTVLSVILTKVRTQGSGHRPVRPWILTFVRTTAPWNDAATLPRRLCLVGGLLDRVLRHPDESQDPGFQAPSFTAPDPDFRQDDSGFE